MTDPPAFVAASLALLATPGPTNTLLATSGAAAGVKRSLKLIPAELSGYAISIATLSLLILPLANASPMVSVALRLACGGYLVWSAIHLWREGADTFSSSEPVSARRVFVTTLLNPKGIVFALVIVPHLGERRFAEAAPYLAGLAMLMVGVAISWVSAGALVGAGARNRVSAGVIRRVGASVLAIFGVMLSASVLPLGAR